MAEISRKKKVGLALLVLALILPLFMASNWGLGLLEDLALSHAPDDWAASLDLGVADFYGISLRTSQQQEVCERFLQAFTVHPRRGYAAYSIATCVEREVGLPNSYARAAYDKFLEDYGEDSNSKEYVEEAQRALVRLRN